MSANEHSLAEIVLVGSAESNDTKQNGISSSVAHTISVCHFLLEVLGFLSLFAHVPGVQEEQVSYCRWMEGVNVPTAVSSEF